MSKIKKLEPVVKTYKLDALSTAKIITDYVDKIGSGLSREHEAKLTAFIMQALGSTAVAVTAPPAAVTGKKTA